MRIRVLYFASARELAGTSEEPIDLEDGATIAGALAAVADRHAALAPHLPRLRVARNEVFAALSDQLDADDVLALIPPVAGG